VSSKRGSAAGATSRVDTNKGSNVGKQPAHATTLTSSARKSTGTTTKSKRQLAHESEAPQWRKDAVASHATKKATPAMAQPQNRGKSVTATLKQVAIADKSDESDSDSDRESDSRHESSDITALIFNRHHKLNLTAQSQEIQCVARAAIDIIHVEIVMVNSYPNMTERTEMVRNACVDATNELGVLYHPIRDRLLDRVEVEFRKAITGIPEARISLIRGDIRDIAVAQGLGYYGLGQGHGDYASSLLKDVRYIFPGDHHAGGRVNFKEPYRHSAVLGVIQQAFFAGKNSFFANHADLFTSTLKNDDEPEVPAAMVALVCTTIHASISEWTTGRVLPVDFTGNQFASVYTAHKNGLDEIHATKPNFYHETMAYLFRNARAATGMAFELAGGNAVTTLMDLSGLD